MARKKQRKVLETREALITQSPGNFCPRSDGKAGLEAQLKRTRLGWTAAYATTNDCSTYLHQTFRVVVDATGAEPPRLIIEFEHQRVATNAVPTPKAQTRTVSDRSKTLAELFVRDRVKTNEARAAATDYMMKRLAEFGVEAVMQMFFEEWATANPQALTPFERKHLRRRASPDVMNVWGVECTKCSPRPPRALRAKP